MNVNGVIEVNKFSNAIFKQTCFPFSMNEEFSKRIELVMAMTKPIAAVTWQHMFCICFLFSLKGENEEKKNTLLH